MTQSTADEKLSVGQRKLLVGVCVLVAAITFIPATYNYLLNPMLEDLGASESQSSLLRQLPSIAALLVIFLSSSLGERLGRRRVMMWCSALFTLGCAMVAVAPKLPAVTIGLVLASAAASAVLVVGMGLIAAKITSPKGRATAFSSFGVVSPLVYMGVPILAGWMLDNTSWRLVTWLWVGAGLVAAWAVWRFIPVSESEHRHVELLTPALAGLTLAAVVQSISAISYFGWLSTAMVIRVAVAIVLAAALCLAFQRAKHPSISLAALRRGGMLILLVVVIVVPFVNLWFYVTIGYQYVFGISAARTAIIMIPAQIAGVIGAIVGRKLIQHRGITFTGVSLLLGLAVMLLASMLITIDSSLWLTTAVLSGYALCSVGAGIAITNSIMNLAPRGEEGSASAFRGAAGSIGATVGVVVMTAIVFAAGKSSIAAGFEADGLDKEQSIAMAQAIRDGSSSEEVSSQYAVPLTVVEHVNLDVKAGMIEGLHAHGFAGALLITGSAAVFWLGRRRSHEDGDASVKEQSDMDDKA